jgi:hypothetical protein
MIAPKKESAPAKKRSLIRTCQFLRLIQSPAAWIFWSLEQRITVLDVELERLGS